LELCVGIALIGGEAIIFQGLSFVGLHAIRTEEEAVNIGDFDLRLSIALIGG